MRKKPEILAPAGSMEGLKAAIAAGCDAVYIGGKRFGARAFANNPDCDEMLEAIAYCHLHNVKIYMTVNTILKNKEISDSLFEYLKPYYEAGLDAVIVQDVGVLHFVKEHFPSMAIHASTQMTLTQGKSTKILEDYHVNRIVPARELSIEELRQMRKDTDMELEVFVHGALCYCYSGQCLFSSMLGGRSGNRGRCAQPCRMPYYIDGKESANGDYLLSPKELCNLPYLPELIEAGVDSFKIEGRMKRSEYAAFVTSMFRKYVDYYFELGQEGYRNYLQKHQKEWKEDMRQLAELYNRNGFTQGYLEGQIGTPGRQKSGQKGQMLAKMRPKHGGVLIGEVISVGTYEVIYKALEHLSAQDVVEFRDRYQKPVYEYTLGKDVMKGQKVTARYQKGSKIAVGDKVYRTKDAVLLERIRLQYIGQKKQIAVCGNLTAKLGEPLQFQVLKDEYEINCAGDICQQAKNQQATKESVEKTLKQTGNSLFFFDSLKITLEDGLFLPVGALKKLRRQALEQLEQRIVESYYRYDTVEQTVTDHANNSECASTITASVMNQEQLKAVLQSDWVEGVYLQTEQMDSREISAAFQKIMEARKRPYLVMPAIFRQEIWNQFADELEKKDSFLLLDWKGYLVKNMESLHFLMKIAGVSVDKIRLDHNMYVMNQEAYLFWKEQGICNVTLPMEATGREIEQFEFLPQTEFQVYGKIPLMVSAQCVCANTQGCMIKNPKKQNQGICFQDQRKREFIAVNCCKYCYNIIYQKEPLDLTKAMLSHEKLRNLSVRYFFSTETGEEVSEILNGRIRQVTQTGHFKQGIE